MECNYFGVFDVVSLFTNAPLEETINIMIKRIYDKNEINTNITKQEKKDCYTFAQKMLISP